MAIGSISPNSPANLLNRVQPQSTVNETSRAGSGNVARGGEGSEGMMPKATVNANGHTIGTIISTKA